MKTGRHREEKTKRPKDKGAGGRGPLGKRDTATRTRVRRDKETWVISRQSARGSKLQGEKRAEDAKRQRGERVMSKEIKG
jgi:hypothetical protein